MGACGEQLFGDSPAASGHHKSRFDFSVRGALRRSVMRARVRGCAGAVVAVGRNPRQPPRSPPLEPAPAPPPPIPVYRRLGPAAPAARFPRSEVSAEVSRPDFGPCRSKFGRSWPNLAETGPVLPHIDRHRSTSVRLRATCGPLRLNSGRPASPFDSKLDNFGQEERPQEAHPVDAVAARHGEEGFPLSSKLRHSVFPNSGKHTVSHDLENHKKEEQMPPRRALGVATNCSKTARRIPLRRAGKQLGSLLFSSASGGRDIGGVGVLSSNLLDSGSIWQNSVDFCPNSVELGPKSAIRSNLGRFGQSLAPRRLRPASDHSGGLGLGLAECSVVAVHACCVGAR